VPVHFDAPTWGRIRSVSRLATSEDVARVYRRNHPQDVAHLSDPDLTAAIVAAQGRADHFGIRASHLRARFTMLDVFRAPGFWADPMIHRALAAAGGTGDIRFGDACMMLKLAATRAGQPELVWW
jgi:hypothetical protein